jgi:cytochrome c oxidase assembly protein subunit 15
MTQGLWALTLALIFLGALVKSNEAGLSVPDWPTTYGENMFVFPLSEWRGNVFYEHTHRLLGAMVGLLTLVLTVWLLWRDRRAWVRACAVATLVVVILQGVLGGLTVLYLLPASLSIAHGILAQSFLLMAVFLAYVYSAERRRRMDSSREQENRAVARWAVGCVAVVWVQLVLGAVMRHTEAGLAIPDFPTMGGRWIPRFDAEMLGWINDWRVDRSFETGVHLPDVTVGQVLIHAAHRLFAVVVLGICGGLFIIAWRARATSPRAARSATAAVLLVVLQMIMGIGVVLSAKEPWVTSLHVTAGAGLLAAVWLCALEALPLGFASAPKATPSPTGAV